MGAGGQRGFTLVLDLPGHSGVTAALVLAAGGYRPVPLYNALPGPAVSEAQLIDSTRQATWPST